jgi:hypothetical protein
MRRICICGTLLLGQCANLAAQTLSPHAQKAVETIRQLLAIGLPDSNEREEANPPDKVPRLLRQLNQELKELIVENLNDQNLFARANAEER